jgi:hypothetical protein
MPAKTSLIPFPQQLAAYKEVDARLPVMIIELADRDAQRDFWYALAGMGSATLLFLAVMGAFVYRSCRIIRRPLAVCWELEFSALSTPCFALASVLQEKASLKLP